MGNNFQLPKIYPFDTILATLRTLLSANHNAGMANLKGANLSTKGVQILFLQISQLDAQQECSR